MLRAFAWTAVGLVLLITGVAQAAAQAPVGDSVTGDLSDPGDPFTDKPGLWVHEIDARSGTAGENAAGAMSWEIPSVKDITWTTDVTCLAAGQHRCDRLLRHRHLRRLQGSGRRSC